MLPTEIQTGEKLSVVVVRFSATNVADETGSLMRLNSAGVSSHAAALYREAWLTVKSYEHVFYSSYREFATLRRFLPPCSAAEDDDEEDDEEEDDEEDAVCRLSS